MFAFLIQAQQFGFPRLRFGLAWEWDNVRHGSGARMFAFLIQARSASKGMRVASRKTRNPELVHFR